jgi:hypothetical protein
MQVMRVSRGGGGILSCTISENMQLQYTVDRDTMQQMEAELASNKVSVLLIDVL